MYHSVPQQEHLGKDSSAGAIPPPTSVVSSFGMAGDPDDDNDDDDDDDFLMTAFPSGNGFSSFSPPPLDWF